MESLNRPGSVSEASGSLDEHLPSCTCNRRASSGAAPEKCNSSRNGGPGIGIPREKLARFNRDGAGMGVGLTGMREPVRDLGGQFELTSVNCGTLVRIAVPAYGRH